LYKASSYPWDSIPTEMTNTIEKSI
jgi:hypothetical protein